MYSKEAREKIYQTIYSGHEQVVKLWVHLRSLQLSSFYNFASNYYTAVIINGEKYLNAHVSFMLHLISLADICDLNNGYAYK